MLKTGNRLSKSQHVKKTLTSGRAFFCPHFTLKFRSSVNEKRFTVIVSTKVSKSAVKRNTVKRVVRELLRVNLERLRFGDYAIIAKPLVSKLSKPDIKQIFYNFLLKSGLLFNENIK